MASVPRNPYLAGPPVTKQAGFFGREDILLEVEATLRDVAHNSVILYGQRRVGKTSLLLQLERRLPDPPFFTVYFDLAGKALWPVDQLLYELAGAAADEANIAGPRPDLFEDNPAAFDQIFLPTLYRALGGQRQPVFLLDEFEALSTPEESLPETTAVRGLSKYLYQLLNNQSYANFVFTAGRRMHEITDVLESEFKADLTRFISVLQPEAARALIGQAGFRGVPRYDEAAVDRLLDLTRGQPYLTQLMGHLLFERAYKRSQKKPHVSRQDVEAAASLLVTGPDDTFSLLWESLRPAERLTLAAIASKARGRQPLNGVEIMDTLIEAGISPDNRALRRAPANLVNWQMLESAAEGYLFFIPLMQEWTALQRPIDQVKNEELDRLDLTAVSLYEAARQAYEEGYSNRAAAQLQQALTRNPNHVPARLLLGTILGEENQLAEAVFQFEAAYKLDPPAARTVLVAALLQFGDALQEAGNYLEARAAYERVLAISPGEKSARARLRAIKRRIKEPSQSRNKQDTSHPEKLGQNRRIVAIMIAMSVLLLVVICTWFYVPTANEQIPASTGAVMISATSAEATAVSADPTQIGSAGPATSTRPSEPSPTGSPDQNAAQELSAATTTETPVAPATPTQTSTPEIQLSGRIVVVGSNSMQPLMEALARGFIDKHANVEIAIEGNSSEAGLEAVQQQTADLGMVSRMLEKDELADLANVQVHQVTDPDPIVIIGHILVPVNSLTAQQIIDIYTGTITNWAEISGVDAPIVVVGRTVGADTRSALEQTIAGGQLGSATGQGVDFEEITDQAVRDTVSSWPYAIGYVHRNAVEPVADPSLASQSWPAQDIALLEVKVLAFNQVEPTFENVERGTYPLVRPFTLLTTEPPSELVERWLEFISSPEGREIIEAESRNTAP